MQPIAKPPFLVHAVKPGCRCESPAATRQEADATARRLAASGWIVSIVPVVQANKINLAGQNPA